MFLYCTADQIAAPTGGGIVTGQELLALREFSEEQTRLRRDPTLSSISVYSRDNLGSDKPEPWKWDDIACYRQDFFVLRPRLAHFYSGTFSKTVKSLKQNGCKVVYTIAAHDKEVSRREHEKLGWPFPYNHLIQPSLWQDYVRGYLLADVIICPSTVAEKTVRAYGKAFETKDIRVVPHGCFLPKEEDIKPLPGTFTVGYMGALSADKGTRYLLEAWKKLDYKNGSLLILAGRDSASPLARHMVDRFGGGNIHLAGWQKNISDFYNQISLYVQPSATEGFGIEVLEAAAHRRPVIVSNGAGAVDFISEEINVGSRVDACNASDLAYLIDEAKNKWELSVLGENARKHAAKYTWDKIRQQYKQVWEDVLR